jgi:hypothetical protein
VTSLSAEAGRPVTVADALPAAERHLAAVFDATIVARTDGIAAFAAAAG